MTIGKRWRTWYVLLNERYMSDGIRPNGRRRKQLPRGTHREDNLVFKEVDILYLEAAYLVGTKEGIVQEHADQ